MNGIRERALDGEELAEFKAFDKLGFELLKIPEGSDSKEIVEAVNAYVDAWQDELRSLLADQTPKARDSVEPALALGIVWGNQIVKAFGWSWVCLVADDSERYAVVSPDRSLAVYATYFIKECLDHTTADCTVMLSFNMQHADRFSGEAPNSYTSVMRRVRRIVPKR
jgi:hypothetical protein